MVDLFESAMEFSMVVDSKCLEQLVNCVRFTRCLSWMIHGTVE